LIAHLRIFLEFSKSKTSTVIHGSFDNIRAFLDVTDSALRKNIQFFEIDIFREIHINCVVGNPFGGRSSEVYAVIGSSEIKIPPA